MNPTATPTRLANDTLGALPAGIETPRYDRGQVKTGIVHIGPGAFFRGHQAVYMDDVLAAGDLRWGICAVSLKSSDLRDALAAQDNLYTVVRQSGSGDAVRVVGSITKTMVAFENPQAVIDQMAHPDVKLVTLTVTQKGYYYDSKSGQLDFNHPDIKKDLESASDPVSTVGYLVAALEKRMQDGTPPFTVMSCDNLPGNGDILRSVVLAYAGYKSPALQRWISEEVAFPNTMVDRIVPKATPEHTAKIRSEGIDDTRPIYTEPFRQWVVEKKSCNDMPDIETAGATLVDDVVPYELMKIRILNGSHMALGPVGFLSGHALGNAALEVPSIRRFTEGFMDEVIKTLPPVPGINIDDYKRDIMERISTLPDDLTRLARNGSQKVSSRFLEPLRDAVSRQSPYDHIAFAVAAWMQYLKGYDAQGQEFDLNDEEGLRLGLQAIARTSNGDPRALLSVRGVFGPDLASHRPFVQKIEKWLGVINARGMMAALDEFHGGGVERQAVPTPAAPAPRL